MKIVQISKKIPLSELDTQIVKFGKEVLHWAVVDVTSDVATLSLIIVENN